MGSPTIFSGRRTRTLTADGLILAAGSKVDFDGVVNYVTNGHAEVNTLGWATYADLAGPAPVDGAGGSPQADLFTRSTATPLRGLASFLLDKTGAANRQGQGASYDFTIDDADKAKRLPITFDYEVASGTYADGDVAMYIIADPNGTPQVIQPAGFSIQNVGIESRQVATWQSLSNVTQYRACFHIASVSTSNYALKIDNVQIGPQNVTFSTPMSDWISYTPTLIGVNGLAWTNQTTTGSFRRVGDSLEVSLVSAFTALPATGTGYFRWTIPTGLTIDTAKVSSNSGAVGSGRAIQSSYFSGSVVYENTNTVSILGDTNSGSFWGATVPASFANTHTVSVTFSVPIVGWSTSAQVVSDSSEGRVVAMHASTLTSTTYTANANLAFVTTTFDTHGAWNGSAYTVRVPGFYSITLAGFISSAGADWGVHVNGTSVSYLATSSATRSTGSTLVQVRAGDSITIRSGTGLTFTSSSSVVLSIDLIQGSQTLLGGETVAASYTGFSNSGAVNTSGGDLITWSTLVRDTTGGMVSGTYTVSVPGLYNVEAQISAVLAATTASLTAIIQRNGSTVRSSEAHSPPTVNRTVITLVSGQLSLIAGDTITVRGIAGFGNATYSASSSANSFSITRVGN